MAILLYHGKSAKSVIAPAIDCLPRSGDVPWWRSEEFRSPQISWNLTVVNR
jgi:hypothetical protein